MFLKRVRIENYRSIKDMTVYFSQQCQILVGINEAGKSNILSALRHLDDDYEGTSSDVREALKDEEEIELSWITFVCDGLDKVLREKLFSLLEADFPDHEHKNIKVESNGKTLSFVQFLDTYFREVLFRVQISAETGNAISFPSYWFKTVPKNSKFKEKLYFIKPETVDSITVETPLEETIILSNRVPFTQKYYDLCDDSDKESITHATVEQFRVYIGNLLKGFLTDLKPEVVFWEYNKSYILPSKLSIDEFSDDPETCIPLKNIFHLAEIDEINETISKAKNKDFGMKKLCEKLSLAATNFVKKSWPEIKKCRIEIQKDGENFEIAIQDENAYSMQQRSEGFKRLVTFLLVVAAREKAGKLNNSLILIDEPDVGLYPKGASQLRDELIRLGSKNIVVFSTHSPAMIDRENLGRHLIVDKTGEETAIKRASFSEFHDEEVIYRAMGSSIYDILKEKNLLFEGWRDKKLFQTYLKNTTGKKYKNNFEGIGLAHSQGVKRISNITAVLELGLRECIIISDGDKPAIEHQSAHKKAKGHGIWVRYDEPFEDKKIVTAEDFIVKSLLIKCAKEITELQCDDLTEETLSDVDRLFTIFKNLRGSKTHKYEIKNAYKEALYEKLKPSHIERHYSQFVESIIAKL